MSLSLLTRIESNTQLELVREIPQPMYDPDAVRMKVLRPDNRNSQPLYESLHGVEFPLRDTLAIAFVI